MFPFLVLCCPLSLSLSLISPRYRSGATSTSSIATSTSSIATSTSSTVAITTRLSVIGTQTSPTWR